MNIKAFLLLTVLAAGMLMSMTPGILPAPYAASKTTGTTIDFKKYIDHHRIQRARGERWYNAYAKSKIKM